MVQELQLQQDNRKLIQYIFIDLRQWDSKIPINTLFLDIAVATASKHAYANGRYINMKIYVIKWKMN